jgi:hypothetical protein
MISTATNSLHLGRAQDDKAREPFDQGKGQLRDLWRFIDHVFGRRFPDDDYGRDLIYELLNQQALNGHSPYSMLRCALTMLPELDDDDSLDEMIKHIGSGRKRTADDLARRIGLDYKTRTELNITTIGSCDKNKAERKAINAQRYAADKRWRREQERMARAADPAAPPKDAAPKKKRRKRRKKATARRRGRPALGEPWKAEGVSKRTWFRHHPATERRGTKIARRRGTKFDRPAAAGSNGNPSKHRMITAETVTLK